MVKFCRSSADDTGSPESVEIMESIMCTTPFVAIISDSMTRELELIIISFFSAFVKSEISFSSTAVVFLRSKFNRCPRILAALVFASVATAQEQNVKSRM